MESDCETAIIFLEPDESLVLDAFTYGSWHGEDSQNPRSVPEYDTPAGRLDPLKFVGAVRLLPPTTTTTSQDSPILKFLLIKCPSCQVHGGPSGRACTRLYIVRGLARGSPCDRRREGSPCRYGRELRGSRRSWRRRSSPVWLLRLRLWILRHRTQVFEARTCKRLLMLLYSVHSLPCPCDWSFAPSHSSNLTPYTCPCSLALLSPVHAFDLCSSSPPVKVEDSDNSRFIF